MANEFREPPRPNYDYDVRKLVSAYERALTNIQAQLNSLMLSDFERASILAVQAHIAATLKELNGFTAEWTGEALTKAVTQGSADAIYALGLASTLQEATNIVKFNRMNKELVKAAIADTQADLLAVTQNVERRTRAAVRTATSEMMRAHMAQGVSGTATLRRDLTKRIRKQLGDAADTSIIDASGGRWKLAKYTDMLVRTKMMEAHKESTINEAVGRDVQYGVISRHGAKDACRNWEGKIVKLTPDAPGNYPYIGNLPRNEIFHPRCAHVVSPVRRPDRLPDDLKKLNNVN
ncbi:phage minor capsid protein [Mesobacillus zeae]|uniref:Minor capsid protein n=1 Tax=Mesobacillus zeae TaxID=1917180 RepID=A0A398BMG0_9BACI|nr:phage minor capsid protein [Mesobacillus zeae]RID88950.1 minor capsid protein [Mesobacillus zeae]